jgi:hypothetical protein
MYNIEHTIYEYMIRLYLIADGNYNKFIRNQLVHYKSIKHVFIYV